MLSDSLKGLRALKTVRCVLSCEETKLELEPVTEDPPALAERPEGSNPHSVCVTTTSLSQRGGRDGATHRRHGQARRRTHAHRRPSACV